MRLLRFYRVIGMIGVSILVIGALCYAFGLRINTTRSIALGLYETVNAPIKKGEYVMWCPTNTPVFALARQRGYIAGGLCPGDYGYIMKLVLGVPGDTVTITPGGVDVNGHRLAYSQVLSVDMGGRPLPHYPKTHYTLGPSQLLLMTDVSNTSFDSRYFGPVNESQVKNVIRPIWTWS